MLKKAKPKKTKAMSAIIRMMTCSKTKFDTNLPRRLDMISKLKKNNKFDVIVIGGGSTGAGVALDAAQRGMRVLCIEREDISSGTSSRSTKLIWGGSRYLVSAFVSLFTLDRRLFTPIKTIKKFLSEFKMVLNCHRERQFLLTMQPHLTNWLPIAVPFQKWLIWPPPFGFPPASLGPLGLFPLFFKFYDALSGFSCPPSHIMMPQRSMRKFTQLANSNIKYCSIFYEGQHDDARTNLAIAQTAAKEGAIVLNYCNLEGLSYDSKTNKVKGATIRDVETGESFTVQSKCVVFCGGPFTDELRKLENPGCKEVVKGAGGIHIVLPAYFAPSGIGLVDMSTSDGRFLFFLPWRGHVLVGTTDSPCKPTMRPIPSEKEIDWLLCEAGKYLSPELKIRRQDVLSAWSGVRPLADDPNISNTSSVSRDHVISHNAETNTIFVAGGKWTTYREMAEDAVDKIVEVFPDLKAKIENKACSTLKTHLVGYEGFTPNLSIKLIQEFGVAPSVATRLSRAYGGRAIDVLNIAINELKSVGRGTRIVPGYPYIEAEVIHAVRNEWALHAEDIIARRTGLAFLNKESAMQAIPKVVTLMAQELGWDMVRQQQEVLRTLDFLRHFGGPVPVEIEQRDIQHRDCAVCQVKNAFSKVDFNETGLVDKLGVMVIVIGWLQYSLSSKDLDNIFDNKDIDKDGKITMSEFVAWWTDPSLITSKSDAERKQVNSPQNVDMKAGVWG